MYLPAYLGFKLSIFSSLISRRSLGRRKKIADHTYQITCDIKLKLRENTTDIFVLGEIFARKSYDFAGFEIKPDDVVVDIGGHIGAFSVYAATKAKDGLVLSYEPVPENFELLTENKGLNDLAHLRISNRAVTSDGRKIKINISSSNSAGHSAYAVDSRKGIEASSLTLEDIFRENGLSRINYLKLDAEGAEFDVILNSAPAVFDKVDKIVMEYHDFLVRDHSHREIVSYLEKCGYTVTVKASGIEKFMKMGMIVARRPTASM